MALATQDRPVQTRGASASPDRRPKPNWLIWAILGVAAGIVVIMIALIAVGSHSAPKVDPVAQFNASGGTSTATPGIEPTGLVSVPGCNAGAPPLSMNPSTSIQALETMLAAGLSGHGFLACLTGAFTDAQYGRNLLPYAVGSGVPVYLVSDVTVTQQLPDGSFWASYTVHNGGLAPNAITLHRTVWVVPSSSGTWSFGSWQTATP